MEHYLHLQTGTACWMYWMCYDKNFLITTDISGAVKYLPKIPRIQAFCNISLQRNGCLTKRCHRTINDGFKRDILDNPIQTPASDNDGFILVPS